MRIHELSLRLRGLFSMPKIINFQEYRSEIINIACLTGLLCTILYSLVDNVEDTPELILIGSVGAFIAGIVLSNQYITLTDETEELSDAREGSYVHASGEIVESDDTFPAPFTDDEGPIIAWKVEEETNNLGRHGDSDELSKGIVSNKFQIEDDNRIVTVDFKDGSNHNIHSVFNTAELNESNKIDTVKVEPGEKPPQRIEDFINDKTDISQVITDGRNVDLNINYTDGRRRYKQYVFKEGDEIYVRGTYKKDGFEDIICDADEGTYVIGDSKDNYMDSIVGLIHWAVTSSLVLAVIGIISIVSVDVGTSISLLLTVVALGIGLKELLLGLKEFLLS